MPRGDAVRDLLGPDERDAIRAEMFDIADREWKAMRPVRRRGWLTMGIFAVIQKPFTAFLRIFVGGVL